MRLLLAAGLLAAITAGASEDKKFVAHEWGTFTSVQGADGVQLEWNPFVVAELPGFVYDRNRPNHEPHPMSFSTYGAKTAFMARQRMETPVIYFYSPEEKTVSVRVDFPSGLMTEWYPHATDCDAIRKRPERDGLKKTSFLEWNNITVTGGQGVGAELPVESRRSHYYPARETDANLLQIKNANKNTTETEKFLFYRGVGHFEAPLQTSIVLDGKILMLKNAGKEELRHVLVVEVKDGAYKTTRLDSLQIGAFGRIDLGALQRSSRDELKKSIEASLASEKLYAAEAKSMVKTWEDSWLDEPGLRVLYVLGAKWTDETLPLQISPKPAEIVRVMVGRAEVITPAMELALYNSIIDYKDGDAPTKAQAVAKARAIGLGRFADAAARRLCKQHKGADFSKAAFEVATKASQPDAPKVAANTN